MDRIGAVSGILFAVLVVDSIQVSMGSGVTSDPSKVAGLTCTAMLLLLAGLGFAASLIGNYEGGWQVAKTILLIGWDLLLSLRGD